MDPVCSCLPSILDGFTPLKQCSLRQAAQIQQFLPQGKVEGSETLRFPPGRDNQPIICFCTSAPSLLSNSCFSRLLQAPSPPPGRILPFQSAQGSYPMEVGISIPHRKFSSRNWTSKSIKSIYKPQPQRGAQFELPSVSHLPHVLLDQNNCKTWRTLGKINLQGITKLKWFQKRILLLQTCRNEQEINI